MIILFIIRIFYIKIRLSKKIIRILGLLSNFSLKTSKLNYDSCAILRNLKKSLMKQHFKQDTHFSESLKILLIILN